MINFYHRFIPNISEIQIPLHKATEGYKKNRNSNIVWSEEMRTAFLAFKEALAQATLSFSRPTFSNIPAN